MSDRKRFWVFIIFGAVGSALFYFFESIMPEGDNPKSLTFHIVAALLFGFVASFSIVYIALKKK